MYYINNKIVTSLKYSNIVAFISLIKFEVIRISLISSSIFIQINVDNYCFLIIQYIFISTSFYYYY